MAFVELKKGVNALAPQLGRPKAENPKDNDVKVRLDGTTTLKLNAYCEKHGVKRAEAIRRGINLLLEQDEKE